MPVYASDFETNTKEENCRVWAWGVADLEAPTVIEYGTDIDGYINYISSNPGIYYFHNLKFDGNFILYWLFKNGYEWAPNAKNLNPGQFSTLISDMGTWYTIDLRTKTNKNGVSETIQFRDSAKIIPLPLEEVPKAFGLTGESKLDIDYHEDREIGHELTEKEKLYLFADVRILAKAIAFMRDNGQTKLTTGANALRDFKSRFTKQEWKRYFPELNQLADRDIRLSYKGGWTYLNPKYRDKMVKEGCVYDVNSMYPWAMKYCDLPWGKPVFFSGEYKPNPMYPLYVINIIAEFHLKPGHYPSIQVKNTMWHADNEYIEHSVVPLALVLTNVDYELFLENYDVEIEEVIGGYMFHSMRGLFDEYIDYWYKVKSDSKRDGNKGMERIAKLMLNALYGKFGAKIKGKSKIPYFRTEEDRVMYKLSDEESRRGGYLPIATFITSYCRDKIIRAANACGERFIYADTDSIHIEGWEEPTGIEIDEYRLGAFKCETKFKRARFIRQKTYLEVYDDFDKKTGDIVEKVNLKCCGMPDKMKNTVSEEDFVSGAVFSPDMLNEDGTHKYAPKLTPKVVPGGVILQEVSFEIKKTEKHTLAIDFQGMERVRDISFTFDRKVKKQNGK